MKQNRTRVKTKVAKAEEIKRGKRKRTKKRTENGRRPRKSKEKYIQTRTVASTPVRIGVPCSETVPTIVKDCLSPMAS